MMNSLRVHPRVLRVEAESLSVWDIADGSLTPLHDLSAGRSSLWHKIEAFLRLDLSAAWQAKLAETHCDFDIVWAGSEKIGIPLSFMHLHKPLVVIAHHMSSPLKARLARATGVVDRWAGIGFISDEGRQFLIDYFGVCPNQLFQYMASKLLDMYSAPDMACDGPIMSVGVAKRDYCTLLTALADLPGCETELFFSSRYGDMLQKQGQTPLPKWVKLITWVSDSELIQRYRRTRFAVVPLVDTTHTGAGISAVLEASAMGKAVIATKTGGMPTFVKDGVTGILVPPYDVNAWRDAICTLLTHPRLADQMGQAGRRYMQERFSPEMVRAEIETFLDDLYVMQHC